MNPTFPKRRSSDLLPAILDGGNDAGHAAIVATPASMPEPYRSLAPGSPGTDAARVSGRWSVRGLRKERRPDRGMLPGSAGRGDAPEPTRSHHPVGRRTKKGSSPNSGEGFLLLEIGRAHV